MFAAISRSERGKVGVTINTFSGNISFAVITDCCSFEACVVVMLDIFRFLRTTRGWMRDLRFVVIKLNVYVTLG